MQYRASKTFSRATFENKAMIAGVYSLIAFFHKVVYFSFDQLKQLNSASM